ncbi:MAG: beta-3-deoxy-D-manno-oct-2-ulosonic acid transferase, partial [Gammaproteobacteria bacterium]|nr:beta-3-deoxy-D-manno-oct-2-ulosonic acid transferase [Gammaproteobacteria bacterium]
MKAPAQRFAGMPDVLYAHAFPRWKWPVVRQCFADSQLVFVNADQSIPAHAWLLLWGRAAVPAGLPEQVRVLRMEDGFIRSIGLGAELVRPLSWVV